MSFEVVRRNARPIGRAILRKSAPTALPDRRASYDQRLTHDRAHLEALLRTTLVVTGTPIEQRTVEGIVDSLMAIHESWSALKANFLQAGRYLLRIEREVPFAYRHIVEHGGLLPFHETMASKLRQIARVVEAGKVEEQLLPTHYTVAYEVAILPDAALARARAEGLLGPTLRTADVRRLKIELLPLTDRTASTHLRDRLRRLRRRRETLDAEIVALERQLAGDSQN